MRDDAPREQMMEPTIAAVRARVTVGEISDKLRAVFGSHDPAVPTAE
jgi:methylmalonyl-CoA mutase N-terminal domain/subunit